jgi:hypothetical protein
MTGPEHYKQAEELLAPVPDPGQVLQVGNRPHPEDVARAQVHATLALAAATALGRWDSMPAKDCDEWLAAASSCPAPAATA